MNITKKSRIYVAGHRGLVGSAIVRRLMDKGYCGLICRAHKELDLTDQTSVNSFFKEERPDYVFLAAARVGGILANDTFAADFIRDNLLIQTNVIDAAYRFGVKKLLFLGSSCIYPKLAQQPIKEEYLLGGYLEPTNQWYAIAKIAGIKMCQAYRRQYNFNAVSVMPTNLYGLGDNFDLETSHVLPALIRKFHLAKLATEGNKAGIEKDEERFGPIPQDLRAAFNLDLLPSAGDQGTKGACSASGMPEVVLWGTGTARRELLHVDDLADACLLLMEGYDSEEIVNVGTGEDVTIKQLAQMVSDIVGFHGCISYDKGKPDGTPQKVLDTSRISSLGWAPHIGLEDGIKDTYEWYQKVVSGNVDNQA